MSDTFNEELSIKERTKSKFDQLLKAALNDSKGDSTRKKVSSTVKDSHIRKDAFGLSKKAVQELDYSGSELKKLYIQSNVKEDKAGLINAGFNEDISQLEDKPTKEHHLKPKKNRSQHEKLLLGNVNEFTVETKNLVNSANSVAVDSEVPSIGLPQTRKHRRKKPHREKSSFPANPNEENVTNFEDKDLWKHHKLEEKLPKSEVTEDNSNACATLVQSSTSSVGEIPAKDIDISPNKKPRKKHKERNTAQLAVVENAGAIGLQRKQILSVRIHRVDRLKMNSMIKHPLVRVHVVDSSNGTCIKHQQRRNGDAALPENAQISMECILPAMTLPFKLKEKRSVLPMWEEVLHFNESYEYLIQESSNTILFFEILDFLPMSAASNQYSKRGAESGWYHIAWAFLKIVGANKKLNVGRKTQLQLYFPPKHRIRPEPRILEVFHWWSSCPRVPYPATLYVTVSGMEPPTSLQPTLTTPVTGEAGTSGLLSQDSKSQPEKSSDISRNQTDHSTDVIKQWGRLPGQSCKVPNKYFLSLTTAAKGCLVATFSHNGKWIACGCNDADSSPILIYEIPSGKLFTKLQGSTSLIYDLHFSRTDDCLLSASADGTARVWNVRSSNYENALVLPHPSYVYTAHFHPFTDNVVITGCYDTVIRIWNVSGDAANQNQLIKELEGHNAYINSICFNEDGTKMYSGDSKGIILIWNVPVTKDHLKGVSGNWDLGKTVCNPELVGISISKVIHHPKLCRLVVQSQDGVIRMLDDEGLQIIQRYKGYLNICDYLRCCLTPCGSFIFTGSEDHCVYAWNTVTGAQAAIYSDLPHRQTVHCAVFHPLDHYVAFCSFGSKLPVLIYKYDPNVGQLGVSRVQPQDGLQSFPVQHPSPRHRSFSREENKRVVAFDLPVGSSPTCLETIIKKLDTVLDISSMTNTSFPELEAHEPNATNMSWGSTFDGLGINPNAATLKKVIAQFEYNPQRSDELPFRKGDIVSILDMESDQWWIGRLVDGRQGYVPAKFFASIECDGEGSMSSYRDKEPLSLEKKSRNVTALLTKGGELTFISDSEDETPMASSTPVKQQRQRRRKQKEIDVVSQC